MSNRVVLIGDLAAIFLGLFVTVSRGRRDWYVTPLLIPIYLVVTLYLAASFGSNFPGWYPALLGVRKTVPPLLFLLVGAVWPNGFERLTRAVLLLLLAACATSLALHNLVPGVEDAINRTANQYTGLYAGVPRLQGVFAGPFHVALAGLALVIASVGFPLTWTSRVLRWGALAVGLGVLIQANVRSGWLALAAGLVVLFLFRATRVPRVVRLAGLVAALLLVVFGNLQALVLQQNAALESLTHWQSDSRLMNRLVGYREALALVARRPLFGWGPGSAADTLDRYFVNGVHVTAHNMLLAYAVEIGVLGAAAVALMFLVTAHALSREAARSEVATWGLGLVVAFVVFGSTGTAVDAAPVSSLVLLLVGLALPRSVARQTANPGAGPFNDAKSSP